MSSVQKRIAQIEGTIEGLIQELAELKVAVQGDVEIPPTLPMTIFNTQENSLPEIKELYVLMDFETGGLGKTEDIRVCQVGGIILDQEMNQLGEFNEFCNPGKKIDESATAVNGITNEFVKLLPGWDKIGLNFHRWIAEIAEGLPVTLVAHNGKRFDFRILAFENARHKIPNLPNLYCSDTITTFKELYPKLKDYKLGTIYETQFKEPIEGQHTALSDCKAMLRLLQKKDHRLVRDKLFKYREAFDVVIKRCFK